MTAEDADIIERANRKTWTIAAIKAANQAGGFYFFSRASMRMWCDTMRSFRVVCEGECIYVERKTARSNQIGRWKFDPRNGSLGAVSPKS